MCLRRTWWIVCGLVLVQAATAVAGMPSPLPSETETVWRLTDSAMKRFQTLSFFLLGFLLCTAAVRALWNYVQRDFPSLPRLSFGKAAAGVFLWGLLFIIVLTMISGARELMTPGAWKKQGFTYKLAVDSAPVAEPAPDSLRRSQLEHLRAALLHFAATHNGRFPTRDEVALIPSQRWEIPETGGMRYLYAPGLTAEQTPAVLVCEPELGFDRRFVLKTNGDIRQVRSADVPKFPTGEKQP